MNYLVKPIYRPVLRTIDALGALFFRKKKTFVKSAVKKIAIIRFDHLGDVILTTPVFRAVRKEFPNAEITVLVRQLAKEVLEQNPNVDFVKVLEPPWFDRENIANTIAFKNFEREYKKYYDLIIELHSDPRNILFARHIGKYAIGYDIRGFGFLLDAVAHYDPKKKHITQRHLDVLKAVGIQSTNTKTDFFIPKETEEKMKQLFAGKKCVCINPGSGRAPKLWLNEHWAEVADYLIKKQGVTIVFTGSQKETTLAEEIIRKMKEKNVLLMTGKTTALELGALIKQCILFLSPDTGPLHIAKAVGTPTIGLFGPVDPDVWGYNEKKHKSIFKNKVMNEYVETNEGMLAITTEDVLRVVDTLLQ